VGAAASVVASLGAVRRALFELQRKFAHQEGGAVLDGRDIGTVIAPDADVKLWVDASVEERARRRFAELSGMGEAVTEHGVLEQLKERDARDAARKDAPMKPADDAIWMDTTRTNPDETLAKAIEIVEGAPWRAEARRQKDGEEGCGEEETKAVGIDLLRRRLLHIAHELADHAFERRVGKVHDGELARGVDVPRMAPDAAPLP
jgi:cytidylate kinase